MILLRQNEQDYNNDLRAMIMAFYPGEKIVDYEKAIKLYFDRPKHENTEDTDFLLSVHYEQDKTIIVITDNKFEVTKAFESKETEEIAADISEDKKEVSISGDYKDRKIFRNKFKLALYNLLSEYVKRKLPWGDLTGVRPTKIAMKAFREGKIREEIIDYYVKTYDTSERKASLAYEVAANETKLVRGIDLKNSYCLYIGIPFCPSRCLYCSFTSYPIELHKDKVDIYIDRLCEELDIVADKYKDKRLTAIYMGGGTPTSINHTQLDRLLTHIDKAFKLDRLSVSNIHNENNIVNRTDNNRNYDTLEYTIEAGRPDSITREKLLVMRAHNVTRISINPQTMNDGTLKRIGRAHTVFDVLNAFSLARECGFDNINMDIIAGLPCEDLSMMEHTLDVIKKLKPDSLTVHSLAIKRAARLNEKMDEYKDEINHDMDAMLDKVFDTAAFLGMKPYYLYRQKNIGGNLENVGYSTPGKECIYNVLIMEELTDIIAVGAGSSSKYVIRDEEDNVIRIDRSENCKSIDDYIDRFDEMIGRKR